MVGRAALSFVLALGCAREPRTAGPFARPASAAPSAEGGSGGASGGAEPCEPLAVGRIESAELDEISGMASSVRHPGVLYVHNDSGDVPRFFAVDEQGLTLAEFSLPLDGWQDVEDVAVGPGSRGASSVYLADVGDNPARRSALLGRRAVTAYRVPEPELPAAAGAKLALPEVEALRFTYPDRPHDAEGLAIDPRTGDLFLVTKEEDGRSLVFRAAAPLAPGKPRELEPIASLHFGQGSLPGNHMTTAADIAPAGDAIAIRTYTDTFVWARAPGASIAQALLAAPSRLRTPLQPQGEAVTFAASGRALYTVSEGEHPTIYRLPCRQ